MPSQTLEHKKDAEKAKALYDYTAANTEEIDLRVDDVVFVEFKVGGRVEWNVLLPDPGKLVNALLVSSIYIVVSGRQWLVDWH